MTRARPRPDHSRINWADMQTETISDTTSATANTSKTFQHSIGSVPSAAFVMKGNAYIAEVTDSQIDVRSASTSVAFTVVLVK